MTGSTKLAKDYSVAISEIVIFVRMAKSRVMFAVPTNDGVCWTMSHTMCICLQHKISTIYIRDQNISKNPKKHWHHSCRAESKHIVRDSVTRKSNAHKLVFHDSMFPTAHCKASCRCVKTYKTLISTSVFL